MIEETVQRIANSMVSQRDAIIDTAITHKLGEEWTEEELLGRAQLITTPQKTEVFAIDGEALVEFYPYASRREGMSFTTTQNYQLLY